MLIPHVMVGLSSAREMVTQGRTMDSAQIPTPTVPTPPAGRGAPIGGVLNALDKALVVVAKVFFWIAAVALTAMFLLVIADVIGIKIFNNPVPGGIEMVAFSSAIAIGFSVAYTQCKGGHVAVDFIVEKFPRKPKTLIDGFTSLFSAGLFAVLAYYTFRYAGQMKSARQVSLTQNIPLYPFIYSLAVCMALTFLVIVRDFVKLVVKAVKQWTP